MKVKPKHLAYASVLAIGAVALALDSAFPPASAAAAIEPPPAQSTAAALASAAAAYDAPLDTGLAPLAERLAQLNQRAPQADAARDVFDLNERAFGLEEIAERPAAEPVGNPAAPLRVTAILVNSGQGRAVINGTLVKVGDWVAGGYRVAEIRQHAVLLDLDGRTVTLQWDRSSR
jgi:hypothetical protein